MSDAWIQDRARAGDVNIKKITGSDNPSDLLTKHLERPLMLKHLRTLGLRSEEGRAGLAPTIDS